MLDVTMSHTIRLYSATRSLNDNRTRESPNEEVKLTEALASSAARFRLSSSFFLDSSFSFFSFLDSFFDLLDFFDLFLEADDEELDSSEELDSAALSLIASTDDGPPDCTGGGPPDDDASDEAFSSSVFEALLWPRCPDFRIATRKIAPRTG
jgi:hypothetical protein